jgi:SAM-dependent methyltransferase
MGEIAMINLNRVDGGKGFDFGKTSGDYAKYRDIYSGRFYETILGYGIGTAGQRFLDLGTGSGVIPRYMTALEPDAKWTGTDISADQIEAAKSLSDNPNINYIVSPADRIPFPDKTFDAVTACQCFWYFPIETTIPEIHRVLRNGGRFAILSMIGLPKESKILEKSEELVLKYNPDWNGNNFDRVKLAPPEWLGELFTVVDLYEYVEELEFTRENWCGRMRACRGIGASLPPSLVAEYDKEHYNVLCEIAGETFTIPHQCIFQIFKAI